MKDFIEQFNGASLDFDHASGSQCVDLAKAWLDWLGYSVTGTWGNAKDWDNRANSELIWIPNTPTGVPQEGDLIVWGMAPYGHIAVFIEGDTNSFRSFDQNYPVGSVCHIQNHNYSNVKGWLHPTRSEMIPRELTQGEVYDLNGRKFWHIPDPDAFNRYIGADMWGGNKNLADEIPVREVVRDVVREVEKVVEVKVPVEIINTVVEQVMIEKQLTDEQKTVLSIWEKIKNFIRRLNGTN